MGALFRCEARGALPLWPTDWAWNKLRLFGPFWLVTMQRELRLIGGLKNEGNSSSLNETRIGTTNEKTGEGMEMLLYDRMMKLECRRNGR